MAPLVILGDKLGLYKTLAAKGPLNTEQLASQTGTSERYVQRMVHRPGSFWLHRL